MCSSDLICPSHYAFISIHEPLGLYLDIGFYALLHCAATVLMKSFSTIRDFMNAFRDGERKQFASACCLARPCLPSTGLDRMFGKSFSVNAIVQLSCLFLSHFGTILNLYFISFLGLNTRLLVLLAYIYVLST